VHRKAIRRSPFRGVAHRKDGIRALLDALNANCHPFAWMKIADQILARQAESDFQDRCMSLRGTKGNGAEDARSL
jgi:hypothetical protein